jgi:dolichyl-phosphate beta-glucosyltransferase
VTSALDGGPAQSCTVVIPCYNEAQRLKVEAFDCFLPTAPEVSFVFVDDGSTDDTLNVLHEIEQRHPERVRVLAISPNGGKADAIRCGMLFAMQSPKDIVGFWDADLATPLDAIPDFLNILRNRPDIEWVFGARVSLLGRNIERSPVRHYLGRVFATVVSTLLRLPIYDTQCGAKLFRATPEFKQVLAEPFISAWISDVEMIARLIKLRKGDLTSVRRSIYEYPLMAWRDVAGSKVKPTDFVRAIVEVFAIWRKYLR